MCTLAAAQRHQTTTQLPGLPTTCTGSDSSNKQLDEGSYKTDSKSGTTTGGRRDRAAKILGISRTTLCRKLKSENANRSLMCQGPWFKKGYWWTVFN
ncbi:MAG: helix-turn-helix domain-containing protein [Candidatus Zixiibacteriota bacterium]|nr:MAG: helix-turn-helix domain-containing protein [candidate division Zixibacteria bacterium]